jgi:hypothetical protein
MRSLLLILLSLCLCLAQDDPIPKTRGGKGGPRPVPDATLSQAQRDAIVKDVYKKSLADAAELLKLAEELKAELEKEDAFTVSVKTIKKTEQIEKLSKGIRGRMKPY